MWLCCVDQWFAVCCTGCIDQRGVPFSSRVAFNIQLFDYSQWSVRVLVLVALHMMEGYLCGVALGGRLTDGHVNVVVVGGGIIGSLGGSCTHVRNIG